MVGARPPARGRSTGVGRGIIHVHEIGQFRIRDSMLAPFAFRGLTLLTTTLLMMFFSHKFTNKQYPISTLWCVVNSLLTTQARGCQSGPAPGVGTKEAKRETMPQQQNPKTGESREFCRLETF